MQVYRELLTTSVYLTANILDVIACSVLVVAAYQHRPKAALAWLIIEILNFMMAVAIFIKSIVFGNLFEAVTFPMLMRKSTLA